MDRINLSGPTHLNFFVATRHRLVGVDLLVLHDECQEVHRGVPESEGAPGGGIFVSND